MPARTYLKVNCSSRFLLGNLLLLAATWPAIAQAVPLTASRNSGQSTPLQSESNAPSRFEVASIRLCPPDPGHGFINNSGSPQFTAHYVSLKLLVGIAFGISSDRIQGGPNWFDSQAYDVNAKAEGDLPLTPKQFQPLLQQLLYDRFHLAAHRATVYRSGYALVVAKNGPRLKPSSDAAHTGYILKDGLNFDGATMETLAGVLSSVAGAPVADQTGLKGEYSIRLSYAPIDANDSSLPTVFTALEEELGLKLVRDRKVPVEVLVIEHVERIPTAN